MILLTEHAEGWIVAVRAQAGSRKRGVLGEHGGALKLAVSAPPEQGKANQALVELLSGLLGVRKSQIALVSGDTTREKRFLIRDIERAVLHARIHKLLT